MSSVNTRIMFLQKQQHTKQATFLYPFLPWFNNKLARCWNSERAKSADLSAYDPSLPLIPTPTFASIIIGTSLAPSPMARVIRFLKNPSFLISSFASLTTSPFCFGDTLQQMTDFPLDPSYQSDVFASGSAMIGDRFSPFTIRQQFPVFLISEYLILASQVDSSCTL